MAKRIPAGSERHEQALVAVEQSKLLSYEASERQRREDNKIRGPQGYGSQFRSWQGGR